MLITLLKNRLAQLSLAVILAAGVAYAIGYKDGTHSERLSAATAANQKIQTQTVKNNAVLAQKESQIIELTNRVTVLIEKAKQNEKIINSTNRISNRFVRLSSGDTMPRTTRATIEANAASDDDAAISSPARVVQYNLLLKQAYDQCRIDYNALIATWQ